MSTQSSEKEPKKEKTFTVIVNGREREISDHIPNMYLWLIVV